MKNIYQRLFTVLSLFIAASAFASAPTGTFTLNSMSINGKPISPAFWILLSGDAATAIYSGMSSVDGISDSNGQETERAGHGIVCREAKLQASKLICIIDFTDLSKGQFSSTTESSRIHVL